MIRLTICLCGCIEKVAQLENLGGTNDVTTTVDFESYQDQDYDIFSDGGFVTFSSCPQIVDYFNLQIFPNSAYSTVPYDVRITQGIQTFYQSTGNTVAT